MRRRVMLNRIEILQAEYTRAVMNPVFDEPEKYCVLLDLIQDAIDKERSQLNA